MSNRYLPQKEDSSPSLHQIPYTVHSRLRPRHRCNRRVVLRRCTGSQTWSYCIRHVLIVLTVGLGSRGDTTDGTFSISGESGPVPPNSWRSWSPLRQDLGPGGQSPVSLHPSKVESLVVWKTRDLVTTDVPGSRTTYLSGPRRATLRGISLL